MTTPNGLFKLPPLTRIQEWRVAMSLEKLLEIKKRELEHMKVVLAETQACRDTDSEQWCVLESDGSYLTSGFFCGFDLGGRAMYSGSLREAKVFNTMHDAREVAKKIKAPRLKGHLLKDLLKFKNPAASETPEAPPAKGLCGGSSVPDGAGCKL